MVTAMRITLAATIALLGGLAVPALAEQVGQYTFTVLRDGDPIGEHRFAFHENGGRVEIEAVTDLEVKFMMVPVYEFENYRREIWDHGNPVLITSETNDDGEKLDITVQPNDHGLTRTVNGRIDHFAPEVKVLGFWDKEVVHHDSFFSVVEDKVIDASFRLIGHETIEVHGTPVDTEHYRMVGDIERDVWFDDAGHAVKVEFERRGSLISYIRNEVEPQTIQCAGTADGGAAKIC